MNIVTNVTEIFVKKANNVMLKLELALRQNDACLSQNVRFCFVIDYFHLIFLQFPSQWDISS